ncbi:MAG TPA: glycosyltransferase family 39 protein [Roseiarcus sp.]|jgi:hypothetical protein
MTIAADPLTPSRAGGRANLAQRLAASPVAAFVLVYGAALAWTFVLRLPLWHMDGLDDAFYVEVAHLWSQGHLPYAAAFDVKPPGLFAILAVVQHLLGPSIDSLRAVAVVFDALAATGLFFLGRRFGAPAVGAFAAILYPMLSELVTSNDAYCPLGAFTVAAFLAALSRFDLVKRAALSGLLIGAAGVVKQTAAFEAIALLSILVGAPSSAGRRAAVAAAFLAGAAIAPLGFALDFAAHGALGPLIDDAILGALIRPASAAEGLTLLAGASRAVVLQKSVVVLFGLACVALLRRRALREALGDVPLGALEVWFALAMLSILAQRAIAITYLGPTIAPGLLLAGLCLTRAAPELRRIPEAARLAALAVASAAIALAVPGNDISRRQETAALASAATAIRDSRPREGDTLYVVNRGDWLYSAVDLPPATRYFYPGHTLCDFFAAKGPALLAGILATEPRYVVVADRRIHYACEQKNRWPVVDAALQRSYRRIAHAAGHSDFYDVYELAGAAER